MGAIVAIAFFFILFFAGSIAGLIAASKTKNLEIRLNTIRQILEDLRKKVAQSGTSKSAEESAKPTEEKPPAMESAKDKEEQAEEDILPLPAYRTSFEAPIKESLPSNLSIVQREASDTLAGGQASQPEPKAKQILEPSREQHVRDAEWWKWLEDSIGKRWITWVGVVILFLATGFFIKYAFENNWLGPGARVGLGVAFGLILVGAGVHFVRCRMRALGQGLIGGGLAILYLSFFAAFAHYRIMSQITAFGCMIVVTAGGMTLAIILDAMAIAFLAVLGGFITPVLLSTGGGNRDGLFLYLLLLDAGVLGAALFKRWRAFDVLAFLGTWVLFGGWFHKYYNNPQLVPTMLWLGAFYIIFLIQPFAYHLRSLKPITGERFAMALSNATILFCYSYYMLHPEHKYVLGTISTSMSVCYLALGVTTKIRIPDDKRSLFGFIALSIMFFTLAIPLYFDLYANTIAWALEGAVLVYLGYRFTYQLARISGIAPLAMAAGRFFFVHWPLHGAAFAPFINKAFESAVFVTACGWVFAIIHQLNREKSSLYDRILKITTAISTGLFITVIVHTEIWQWLGFLSRNDCQKWAVAFVWIVSSAAYLGFGLKLRSFHSRIAGLFVLTVAGFLVTYDYGMLLDHHKHGALLPYIIMLNGRYAAGLFVTLVVFAYAYSYRRFKTICTSDEQSSSIRAYLLAVLLLLILTSVETWKWFALREAHDIARCLLICIWVLGSAGYLAAGMWQKEKQLRVAGLGALAIAGLITVKAFSFLIGYDYYLFVNPRFAAGLTLPLMAFIYAYLMRRLRKVFLPEEQTASVPLYLASLGILLILTSVETWQWFMLNNMRYLARAFLVCIWVAGSIGYLLAGIWQRTTHLRVAGLVALAVAGIIGTFAYGHPIHKDYLLIFNARFGAGICIVLIAFTYPYVIRRFRRIMTEEEMDLSLILYAVAISLATLLLSVETRLWFYLHGYRYVARCVLALLWTGCSAAYIVSGFTLHSVGHRTTGLVVLAISAILAASGYGHGIGENYLIYINGRFAVALAALLMLFAHGYVRRRFADRSINEEKQIVPTIYGLFIALLFVILNVETYLYFMNVIQDAVRARRLGQMYLSILWGVYASVMLGIGFWQKKRIVRLTALGLFGLTCLKLVIIDMSHLNQIYRIVSFFVLGMLMIGAAYLYHKIEKLLE